MQKKIPYTEAIEELEKIVTSIENEDVNVDELSVKVKRAAQLINICKEKLQATEEEVDSILKELIADMLIRLAGLIDTGLQFHFRNIAIHNYGSIGFF